MKKLFTIFALSAVLALAVVPVAMAQDELPDSCKMKHGVGVTGCPAVGTDCVIGAEVAGAPSCGLCCLLDTIYTVTNWIFFLMMVLATLLIIIGGVMYMTAGGNPDNAAKGKNYITYAIIGLAIALIARFIPPVVKFVMGVS